MAAVAGAAAGTHAAAAKGAVIRPLISDWQYLGDSGVPPSEAACNAVGRRCFNPTAMANSYNYAGLHALGDMGQGKTIAVVDSFGEENIRQDLGTFNTAFGLPHLCGETGPNDPSGNCPSTTSPRFDIVQIQGWSSADTAAAEQRHWAREPQSLGPRGGAGRRVGARDRAAGEHHARGDAHRRDARRAGLPADDERRAVADRQRPGGRDQPELRLG